MAEAIRNVDAEREDALRRYAMELATRISVAPTPEDVVTCAQAFYVFLRGGT